MSVGVLLVAGPIATGKTAVANELAIVWPARLIKVRQALADVLGIDARDRLTLQREGADLDRRTRGAWLRDYLLEHGAVGAEPLVVDSLRTRLQTLPVLNDLVDARLVFLSAHKSTRRYRYQLGAIQDPVKSSVDFDTAMHHPTEFEVEHLRPIADLGIDTDDLRPDEIASVIVDTFGKP